jgi:hypothetical protein
MDCRLWIYFENKASAQEDSLTLAHRERVRVRVFMVKGET